MRKFIKTYSLAVICLIAASCFAQETVIDQYQYWFDNDFDSAVTIPADQSKNSELTDNLLTEGLNDGTHTLHFRAHDTNGLWSCVKGMLFIKNMAQWANAENNSVQRIQFWFDNDFDNAVTIATDNANSVIFNASLDTDALKDGVHTLNFRFQDTNGLWSCVKGMLFIKNMAQWTNAQGNGIHAYQYWIDNDFDNAVTSMADDKKDFLFSESIDLNTLKNGVHFLYTRFQDKNGIWSGVHGHLFVKRPADDTEIQLNTVTDMQFWVDNGFENAETISVTGGSNTVFTSTLDLSEYDEGIHILCYRFRDKKGKWSSVSSQFLMKNVADLYHTANNDIRAMQYWIDGNYDNALMLTANGNDFSLLENIEANALNDGLHTLNFRCVDNSNVWSATASQFFFKHGTHTLLPYNTIARLEYWFDNDFGEKAEVALDEGADLTILNKLDATALEYGLHTLNFRFMDKNGIWSATSSQFVFKNNEMDLSGDNAIAAIRYWFDNDYQHAETIGITTLGFALTEKIDANTLNDGLHILNIHFMDRKGVWSSATSQFVFKDGSAFNTENNKIAAYQYWMNDDYENAIYTELENAGKEVTIDDKISFLWIEKGDYIMNYRFEDANGKWSPVISDTITKISLPMAEFKIDTIDSGCRNMTIAFSGRIIDGDIYLWDFGDGETTDTALTLEHAFSKGDYEVSLTVKDSETQKEFTVKRPVSFIPDVFSSEFYEIACDNYHWSDSIYTETGEYERTFQNIYGCDSIVTLHLTVNHSEFISLTDTVIVGNDYEKYGFEIPSESIQKVQEYTFKMEGTTTEGCDSIVSLKLIVVSRPEDGLFEVYYNKRKGVLGITVPVETQKNDIEIYDALGRKRYTIPFEEEKQSYAIDMEPGVYLLRCGTYVRKFIVGD